MYRFTKRYASYRIITELQLTRMRVIGINKSPNSINPVVTK